MPKLVHKSAPKVKEVSKPTLCRIARRSGLPRVQAPVYVKARDSMDIWMHNVCHLIYNHVVHQKKKVITGEAVRQSLKTAGVHFYG